MNENDKLIVHIVTKEKFSVGYINFMKINMTDSEIFTAID